MTRLLPRTLFSLGTAFVAGATFVVAGCTITGDQEVALGRNDADSLNAALPLLHDPNVTGYVTTLGDRIASHTARRDLHWTFYVVNTRTVNAFALPGGFIYVDRGLIEATSTEAELAGALAHEIGHVVERHAVKQMEMQVATHTGLSVVCSLTDACTKRTPLALTMGRDAAFARFSQDDEAQADSEAVENTLRAGIDPRGVPALFEELLQRREYDPTPLDRWFLDHPLEETRIQHSQQLIAAIDPDELQGLEMDSQDYHAMKLALRHLPEPPSARDSTDVDDSLPDVDGQP